MQKTMGTRLLAVLLGFGVLALWATPVMATGIDLTKIPKPKTLEFLPQTTFEAQTQEVTENFPYKDDRLSYGLRVPKDWIVKGWEEKADIASKKTDLGNDVLTALGQYIGTVQNLLRSRISVEAQGLGYEISVQNWFLNFVLKNGFTLMAFNEKSRHEIEALYVQVIDDQTYVVRTRVLMNGSRLLMARYYLPQENYESEKALQSQIISSFHLLQPTTDNIEPRKDYAFFDQSYISFPASWTLRENKSTSIERMDASLRRVRKEEKKTFLDGQIKVNVISRLLGTKLSDEIAAFRKGFVLKGYTIGGLVEKAEYAHDPSIKLSKTEYYKLVPSDPVTMKPYELGVSVLEGEEYYYIITLITPSRDDDFFGWAHNMEAFRIVSESTRRFEKPEPVGQ